MSKVTLIRDTQGDAYVFYCLGCGMNHIVPVSYTEGHTHKCGKLKPTWDFNGDVASPTFKPAFVVEWVGAEPPQRCECIIRNGELIYLVGSTHYLSGRRVKMEDDV